MGVEEIGDGERDEKIFNTQDIWEWIAKSMMTTVEFGRITSKMQTMGMDVPRLTTDPYYLENEKENINAAFKDEFGAKGPNTKGLIMLSQRCTAVPNRATEIRRGYLWNYRPWNIIMWVEKTILGLDESYLVAEPSETKGKLVLREIERGGNFGYYDKRNEIRRKGVLIRAVMDSYRLFQLISIQPSEAIKRLQWKLSNKKSMKKVLNVG